METKMQKNVKDEVHSALDEIFKAYEAFYTAHDMNTTWINGDYKYGWTASHLAIVISGLPKRLQQQVLQDMQLTAKQVTERANSAKSEPQH
jgi:hypothetical protein